MANVRELKGRIKSVQNIRQITRAMEMVATTKLRRFQARAESIHPYARTIRSLVARLSASPEAREGQELFGGGREGKAGILLLTSDRGLCGAYNTNILHLLERHLQEEEREPLFYVFGRKGASWLRKKGYQVKAWFQDPPLEKADFKTARRVASVLVGDFLSGETAHVRIVYTLFLSMVRYQPTVEGLLPLDPEDLGAGEEAEETDYILEPGPREILSALLPRFLEVQVFHALAESLTSEYASRRVSMKNATDAAGDMRAALIRTYNRARQESITKELLDIVGGAEALR